MPVAVKLKPGRSAESGRYLDLPDSTRVTEKGSLSVTSNDALKKPSVKAHLKAVEQIRLASTKR